MKSGRWQWLKRFPDVLAEARSEPAAHARRQLARQRNIFLPARLVVAAIVLFQFYTSRWLGDPVNPYGVIFETILNLLVTYTLVVLAVTTLFYVVKKFPLGAVQWFVFALGKASADDETLLAMTVGELRARLRVPEAGLVTQRSLHARAPRGAGI